MDGKVRQDHTRSVLLPFFGIVLVSVLVGLMTRGLVREPGVAESATVLPFGG